MTEPREGWALTSNGRNYGKVQIAAIRESRYAGTYYVTNRGREIWPKQFCKTEHEAVERSLEAAKASVGKARKQLANAEKDEARLVKRMKELEA